MRTLDIGGLSLLECPVKAEKIQHVPPVESPTVKPRMLNTLIKRAALAAALAMSTGCASTKIEMTGSPLKEPLCQAGGSALTTVIYWGAQWRPDQKEPPLREAAALRGIEDFLTHANCLSVVGIHRLPAADAVPSAEALLHLTDALPVKPERVVHIVVRELGPRLIVGVPVIVEGGTEVLIDVRVLDTRDAAPLAHTSTLWRNGGVFVIKGVKTLDQDMSAALRATLMPGS